MIIEEADCTILEEWVEIPMYHAPNKRTFTLAVDREDFEQVARFKWHLHFDETNVYAARRYTDVATGRQKKVYLHRWLLGVNDRKVFVDHKDRDGLNCRRNNLTAVDCSGNNQNKTKGMMRYAKLIKAAG